MNGPVFKIDGRPAGDRRGPLAAQVLPRRAAAALERAPRRHEPGRPAAADPRGGREVRALAAPPPVDEAGAHLPVADQRPQRVDFDRWMQLDLQYIDNWSPASTSRSCCRPSPWCSPGAGPRRLGPSRMDDAPAPAETPERSRHRWIALMVLVVLVLGVPVHGRLAQGHCGCRPGGRRLRPARSPSSARGWIAGGRRPTSTSSGWANSSRRW